MNQKHKLQHNSNKKYSFKQSIKRNKKLNYTKSIPHGGAFMLCGSMPKKQKLLLHQHKEGGAITRQTPSKLKKKAQHIIFMERATKLIEQERKLLRYHNDDLKGQVDRQKDKLAKMKSSGVQSQLTKLPAEQSQLYTFEGQLEQHKKLITKHEKKIRNHVFGLWEKDKDKNLFMEKYTNIINFYTKKQLNATRKKLNAILADNTQIGSIEQFDLDYGNLPNDKDLDDYYKSMEDIMNGAGITKKIRDSNEVLENVKDNIDIVKRLRKEFDIIKKYKSRNDGIEEPKKTKEEIKETKEEIDLLIEDLILRNSKLLLYELSKYKVGFLKLITNFDNLSFKKDDEAVKKEKEKEKEKKEKEEKEKLKSIERKEEEKKLEEKTARAKNMESDVIDEERERDLKNYNEDQKEEEKKQVETKSVSGKILLKNITDADEKRILEKEIKDEKKKLSHLTRSQRKKKAYENVLTNRGYPIDNKTGKFELNDGKPKELEIIEDKFSLVSRTELIKYIKKFDRSKAKIIYNEITNELSKIQDKKYNVKDEYSETFIQGVKNNLSYANQKRKNTQNLVFNRKKDHNTAIDNVLKRRGYKMVGDNKFVIKNEKPYNIFEVNITLKSRFINRKKMKLVNESIENMANLLFYEINITNNKDNEGNFKIKKYINILIELMPKDKIQESDNEHDVANAFTDEIISEVLKSKFYKPEEIKVNDKEEEVTLRQYNDEKGEKDKTIKIDTSKYVGETIIVTSAISDQENEDNAKKNEEENIDKLLGVLENETKLKQHQKTLANLSSMKELLEIKKDLGKGFDIDDQLNTIKYEYGKLPLKKVSDKDTKEEIFKLIEELQNADLKKALREILSKESEEPGEEDK